MKTTAQLPEIKLDSKMPSVKPPKQQRDRAIRRSEYAQSIVETAVRWCANILVEVQSNYAEYMPEDSRLRLRRVVQELNQFK